MRFIEAPIATAMKAFATTPPVREVSIIVNAYSIVLIKASEINDFNILLLLGFWRGMDAFMLKV